MWAKSLAAILLGFPLAVLLIGSLSLLFPGPQGTYVLPWLLWSFPTWVACMALCFIFRSAKQTWLVMLVLLGAALALLQVIKYFSGSSL